MPFLMRRPSAAVSPDGKYAVIVSGGRDGLNRRIVVMDAKTLKIQRMFRNYIYVANSI